MSDSESESPTEFASTDSKPESALRENICRKGANSYYYAHGKKIDGPQWDGKEQPRLLGTVAAPQTTKIMFSTLESFSWLDETKHVKVYVEFNNAHEVDDNNISLESDETSFSFKVVANDGQPYILGIGPLFAEIEQCSVVKKTDKFIIKLKKKLESSWYQLKK